MPYGRRKSTYLGWPAILAVSAIPLLLFAWGAIDQLLPGEHGDGAGTVHRMREVLVTIAFVMSLLVNLVLSHVLALCERLRNRWQFIAINSALILTLLLAAVAWMLERR
jgi:hypothetical protein